MTEPYWFLLVVVGGLMAYVLGELNGRIAGSDRERKAALSAPAGLDVHLHEWCRETGSTALLCLGCGSVLDHNAVKPAASLREFLVQQRDGCSCGKGGRTES